MSLVSWRETIHCLLQKAKYVYDDQRQQSVVWNTYIKWKKMPCYSHSLNLWYYHLIFDVAKRLTVGCFFFFKKDDDSRPQGVQLLVVSHCLATSWGNRHLLFMADGAWVPWTEPMNLMAVQSAWPPGMHFWNIYKTVTTNGIIYLPLNWCRISFC